MKKQFSKGWLAAGTAIMLVYGCGTSDGNVDQQDNDKKLGNGDMQVALPVDMNNLTGVVCSNECQTPGSDTCVECLIDECKKVAGDMAPMCDQIADIPWDDQGDGGAVVIDVDCTDPSDPECAEKICKELCGTDSACLDACVKQVQQGPDDDCSVSFICVDECNSNDEAACNACLKAECEKMCEGLPVSASEMAQCKAACQDINIKPDNTGTCEGGTVAVPNGVTVYDFIYGGNDCPVSFTDSSDLMLTNGGNELELRLPANSPDIVADATGKSFDRAICMLSWSFANVPADMCWSTGEVTFHGQAVLGSGSGEHYAISEFAFGASNSAELDLTTSGAFTNTVPANNAVCSNQGGGNIYHLHNAVQALAGAKVSSEHVQRIPIRWFACP